MSRARRLFADIGPLRQSPAFRRLWAGTTLSAVGGALTTFAVPLQVHDITRSPLAAGASGVAQLIPTITIGLLGGALADAVDRRKLVLAAGCGNAAVSAGLAAQAFAGLHSVWLLYALVAVLASFGAIGSPRRTFIPGVLPADQVAAGLALNRLSFYIMLTAGPALAGLIAAVPGLGLRVLSRGRGQLRLFAVRGGPAARPPPPSRGRTPRSPRGSRGNTVHRTQQGACGRVPRDLNATIFGLAVALFPAINADRFGGNPRTLGLFTAAIGVGGLVSGAAVGPGRARRAAGPCCGRSPSGVPPSPGPSRSA
jgi:MFS family permease